MYVCVVTNLFVWRTTGSNLISKIVFGMVDQEKVLHKLIN